MAETVQQQLRDLIDGSSVALRHDGAQRTWREHLADAAAQASALLAIADSGRPLHIGTLLGNTPAMLTAMKRMKRGGAI